jgi:two-component sensor histidine kinase/CHASE3 domain sensor protein
MQDLHEPPTHRQRALVATVALSFVLLLASAGLVWDVTQDAQEADRLVVHTLQVKQRLAEILTVMTAAESGQRGYLFTGDRQLLEPYESARATVPDTLKKLRELVADNPPQITRVDELTALIERRFAAMDETLRWSRESNAAQAVEVLRTRGQALMNEFRRQLRRLDEVESALLLERQERAAANRERFFQAVAVMLVSCGFLALFALISVRRYLATLESSRALLSDQNRVLEERVHKRTIELEKAAELANRERTRAEALLTDVNHRVGNNLALVSSFLTMQLRAVRHPEAAKALDAARGRVQAIASAHRKLRLGADFATVRANEVLAAVIEDISAGLPPGDLIKINYDVEALEINARDAVSLGVLTSELVMNAVKHAFGAGEPGLVNVRFAKSGTAAPFIEVADNGMGWHEKQKHEGSSLGGKIIDMVARQFGGRPERAPAREGERRPGTRIRIELSKLQLVQPAS